ncbi:hypothetical protein LTR37_002171 [Vermiconidia calcicola]|uniref:Uncharacterized protein n=1 Tax=Vermiconidia calcicola TaxID=1690605 RepID=A0ACC3NTW0_9PEZI|nr:hypothetical protein LTR37_002171 [Vermiconidia calcicola]
MPGSSMTTCPKHATAGASAPMSYLLRLPPELRLTIYDMVFRPLAERSEHLDTYMLIEELPKTDLSDYLALLRTCKDVHGEAKRHFGQQHLPQAIFCFTDDPSLHQFHSKVRTLGPRFQDIQFLLRTEVRVCKHIPGNAAGVKSNTEAFGHVQLDIEEFIALQPGFLIDEHKWELYRETQENCLGHKAPPAILTAGKAWAVEENGIISIFTERNSKAIDVRKCPVARNGGELDASTRWVCGDASTAYSQLKGLLKDVDWDAARIFSKRLEGAVKRYSGSPPIEAQEMYKMLLDNHVRKPLGLVRADNLVEADQDAEAQNGGIENASEESEETKGEEEESAGEEDTTGDQSYVTESQPGEANEREEE